MKNKIILGIAGRAYSGKDTAAKMLMEFLCLMPFAFASTVKACCASLLDMTQHEFEQLPKEQIIDRISLTPRQLMQEQGRLLRRLHPNFLISALDLRLQKQQRVINSQLFDGVIITDVRTETEAWWIRGQGGTVLHIKNKHAAPTNPDNATEQDLNVFEHDHVIRNDGTLDELAQKLKHVALELRAKQQAAA